MKVILSIEKQMRVTPLQAFKFEIVKQRIDAASRDIGVVLQIERSIEQWMRTVPLFPTLHQIVRQRILDGIRRLR